MADIRLELYGQSIKVLPEDAYAKSCVNEFCRSMIKYKMERVVDPNSKGYHAKFIKVPDCTYAASPLSRAFYCIHIGQKAEFLNYLSRCGIAPTAVETVEAPFYEAAKADLKMKPHWKPKPEQVPVLEYLHKPGRLKILPLRTGGGKTYLSLQYMADLGERWMLTTRGGYIAKWIEDVKNAYDIDPDRILAINGEKKLLQAIELAKAGEFDFDVILLSSDTYSNYIRHWEQYHNTELGESYTDPRLFGVLFKIGTRVVDEAHQMLHAYYRIDLYSHYNRAVFLSATIIGNDALERRVHEIIYPSAARYESAGWKEFITATALRYNLEEPYKARYTDPRKNYSHVVYEQYLMRNKTKLKNYLNLIGNLAQDFIATRKPGQKYMIFASTVDMCDCIVKHLKERLPHIRIGRYTAEDKLEELYGYEISATTPGSGGTGIDNPDLAKALSTTAISSSKLNLQMLGRLRELKNYPGDEPEYQYLVCSDIPKHLEYHKQKLELFKGKVKAHRVQSTGALV